MSLYAPDMLNSPVKQVAAMFEDRWPLLEDRWPLHEVAHRAFD